MKLTSLVLTFLSIYRDSMFLRNRFYKSPAAGDQFYSSTLISYEKIFPPRFDVPSIWISLVLEKYCENLNIGTKWENFRITPGRHLLVLMKKYFWTLLQDLTKNHTNVMSVSTLFKKITLFYKKYTRLFYKKHTLLFYKKHTQLFYKKHTRRFL